MDKKIQTLRKFFQVSKAAFDFTNAIQFTFNGIVTPNKMQQNKPDLFHPKIESIISKRF